MEETVNQRIRQIIENENLSVNAFAKKIGVPQRTLANMLSRGTEPSTKTVNAVINAFPDLSQSWLLTGEGDMLVDDSNVEEEEQEMKPRLPTTVAAGTLVGFADSVHLYDCELRPVIKVLPAEQQDSNKNVKLWSP